MSPEQPLSPPRQTSVSRDRQRPASLAADLRVAVGRTSRRLRHEKSDDDITDAQFCVIAALDRFGPMTPGELADHEHVRPPSMTRTIAALDTAGLVTRTAHPDDGRAVLVAISDRGTAEIRETRRRRDAWLARRLAELTPQDRETLARAAVLLRAVIEP